MDYLIDEISQLDVVSKIEIYLNPSNPSPRRHWRKVDEKLHELELAKYQETLEASPGGSIKIFNFLGDELFRQKILMASDGYGLVQVTGFRPTSLYYSNEEDERRREAVLVSTGDQPITTHITEGIEDSGSILVLLLAYFRQLKKPGDNYDET